MSWHRTHPGHHHLVVCFLPDGTIKFYPTTEDPPEFERRFRGLLAVLIENPSLIDHVTASCVADGEFAGGDD